MNDNISPKYQMQLIKQIEAEIWKQFGAYKEVKFYIKKWHEEDDYRWQNFNIFSKEDSNNIDLSATLHAMNGDLLIKIAIDLGLETPDFIPSIPHFRNKIKSDYNTASQTFENALKMVEKHPDMAISLANSALEGIIKEILKDKRLQSKYNEKNTLYALTQEILKALDLFPDVKLPPEIKSIGSSLLNINQNIETLRSTKTNSHGKTDGDFVIEDTIQAYFILNSVATVGLFIRSHYKNNFSKVEEELNDDIPF